MDTMSKILDEEMKYFFVSSTGCSHFFNDEKKTTTLHFYPTDRNPTVNVVVKVNDEDLQHMKNLQFSEFGLSYKHFLSGCGRCPIVSAQFGFFHKELQFRALTNEAWLENNGMWNWTDHYFERNNQNFPPECEIAIKITAKKNVSLEYSILGYADPKADQ